MVLGELQNTIKNQVQKTKRKNLKVKTGQLDKDLNSRIIKIRKTEPCLNVLV